MPRISQLPPATETTAADTLVVNQGGTTKRFDLSGPITFGGSITLGDSTGDVQTLKGATTMWVADQSGVLAKGLVVQQESFIGEPFAASTHWLEISPGPGGIIVKVEPDAGSEGIYFYSEGDNSRFTFAGGSGLVQDQFYVLCIPNAVNNLFVAGGATGGAPTLAAVGTDTNVGIFYATQGTGAHAFATSGGTQASVVNTADAVNTLQLSGGAASGGVNISAAGGDTNVPVRIAHKGESFTEFWHSSFRNAYVGSESPTSGSSRRVLGFDGTSGAAIDIGSVNSGDLLMRNAAAVMLQVMGVASGTNWPVLSQSATTDPILLYAAGNDSNIEFRISSKGTSPVTITGNLRVLGATAIPNTQSANYTLVLNDANGSIIHPSSDNNPRTFTIPADASVAYAIGTMFTFVNRVNNITIAITSDTLIQEGTGSTGSRTLPAGRIATAIKVANTEWMIGGAD